MGVAAAVCACAPPGWFVEDQLGIGAAVVPGCFPAKRATRDNLDYVF